MANRQILRGQESEQSMRQKAFQEGMDQFAQAGSGAWDSIKKAEATKRQIALAERKEKLDNLKLSMQLSEASGKIVPTEQVERYKETGHFEKQLAPNEFGPEAPSGLDSIMSGIMERKQKERERKQSREDIKDQFVEARTGKTDAETEELELPYEQSRKGKSDLGKLRMAEAQIRRKKQIDERERGITGRGMARTRKEAQDIRKADTAMKEAVGIIKQIRKVGKNIAWWDVSRKAKLDSLKSILAGKLRLPITGPGILTKEEFNRLVENMGDPSATFSTEKREFGKLDQLEDILTSAIDKHWDSIRDPYSELEGDSVSGQMSGTQKGPVSADSHPEKEEALRWAQENPDNPKSEEILKRFGGL